MELRRRQFLHLACAAAALPALRDTAAALDYPTHPVRLVVPFAPAGGADFAGRLIGQVLSERLGQPFVIENRPGAAGNVGTEAVVRAPGDGYTLLVVLTPNAVNATLYDGLNFNFIRDIAAVASFSREPNVMLVNPSVPARTVPEFIAYAKANPGRVNMASSGNGTTPHLAGELFKIISGVNMLHVPYRSAAPALTDLLGGQVQLMFPTMSSSLAYAMAGKLRALAVTSPSRVQLLPDVPAVAEFLPGYEAGTWYGVGAPKSTPTAIVAALNSTIDAGLADPRIKASLAALGSVPMSSSTAGFEKFIVDETEKWGKVVKLAGIKPE